MKDDHPPTRPSPQQKQPRVVRRNPWVTARREEAEVAIILMTRTGQKPIDAATATIVPRKEDASAWSDIEPEERRLVDRPHSCILCWNGIDHYIKS
jgi:hypothetical protein